MKSSPGFTAVLELFRHKAVRFFKRAGLVRRTSMKRESSPSDGGCTSVDMKCRFVLLVPTALPLMGDVKVEDIEAENAGGSGAELIVAGRNVFEELLIAMKSLRMVYDVPCQGLWVAVEQPGQDTIEGVHAVTSVSCGPP